MTADKNFDTEKGVDSTIFQISDRSTDSSDNSSNESPDDVALFKGTGEVNLIPMPTANPNDPLNFSIRRKFTIIAMLSCYGAMASAAEIILGNMLPIFRFLYAGILSKHFLLAIKLPPGANGITAMKSLPGPAIWKVYLIGSLPVLMIGIANFIFVPLSISIGRRPVILGAGIVAVAGVIWAGNSQSLGSHVAARAFQALGSGTVESLIPFIIQDMVFIHQRNMAVSSVFGAQGLIIAAYGVVAPYIIVYWSWRWVYFITAIATGLLLIGVFFILPETRFDRTPEEIKGFPLEPLPADQNRPALDYEKYPLNSYTYNLAILHCKRQWKRGLSTFKFTITTFFYPHIFFITMLNSVMITAAFGAGYTCAPPLLTAPWNWKFTSLGFAILSVVVSGFFTWIYAGFYAEWFANWMSRKTGRRDAENQVLNLMFPCVVGLVGTIMYGLAGDDQEKYPWPVFVVGIGFIYFGFLATNSIGIVYVLESYPKLGGPALINIASIRCILAFLLTFKISDWVADLGYLKTFAIYGGIMGGFILLTPVVYFFGPAWRRRWPGPNHL